MTNELDTLKAALSDRYAIEREIGSGGMAVVYLAEDLKHKRKVAVKVLRPELAAALGIERFVREIETTANLTHPNILPLLDSGSVEEPLTARLPVRPSALLFYVMPYVEGESLRERLDRDGKIPIAEMVRLTDEIAAALSYAHDHGIVHRDVKPENIMLTDGRAVVTDFGIARAVSTAGAKRLTETGIALGTPAYMSPEQAFGETNIDGRSDVYALGCVVYEMASGRAPFDAATPQALLAKHAVDTPPHLRRIDPNIPLYVERAVGRALAKEPVQRFDTPSEFAATLIAQTVLPQVGRRRLAVLPPINLINDPEQEYFVQGMHNALISELQKVGVPVIARTSMLRYQSSQKPAHEIAGELGVDVLVEPSVFRSGDNVELEVRVVDGSTEEYLSDPIAKSGEIRNVVSLYRDLTRAIAGEIQAALTPQAEARLAGAREVNPQAYEAFLRGQFHFQRLTAPDLQQAQEYFEQALRLDSKYAPAQAGLALVWIGQAQMMLVPAEEAATNTLIETQKALALDSNVAEVQLASGLLNWQAWNWESAEAALRKAIELNPDYSDARALYSSMLYVLDRPAEARSQIECALESDPLNALMRAFNGFGLFYERCYTESVAELEAALRLDPSNPVAFGNLATAYHLSGKHDEAIALLQQYFLEDQEVEEAVSQGYSEGGYRGALVRFAETLAARPEATELNTHIISTAFAWAGDKERALEWLELAYQAHSPNLPYANQPDFELVHDDPRYRDLRRRMGLPEQ